VLSRADWVCVALPLTPDTREIFHQARFAQMKRGAHFINVGRGELVNEDALIDALRTQHLAGAALDVFATEPLPEDSPLWEMPNVIITPHSSGASTSAGLRSEKMFVHNLTQYLADQPLTNEVSL
jgi:phosphoglycerate dehydrogenase-like enzyme